MHLSLDISCTLAAAACSMDPYIKDAELTEFFQFNGELRIASLKLSFLNRKEFLFLILFQIHQYQWLILFTLWLESPWLSFHEKTFWQLHFSVRMKLACEAFVMDDDGFIRSSFINGFQNPCFSRDSNERFLVVFSSLEHCEATFVPLVISVCWALLLDVRGFIKRSLKGDYT